MIANSRIDPGAYPPSPIFAPSAPPAFQTPSHGTYPQLSSMQHGMLNVPSMEYSVPGAILTQQPVGPQIPPPTLKPIPQPHPAPALNEVSINEERVRVRCPYCYSSITTKVSYSTGTMTHIAAVAVLVVCCPFAWIPYCVDCCKDVDHSCPSCGRSVAKFKRFQ